MAAEDAQALKAWIEPIVQSVGAEVLVTDALRVSRLLAWCGNFLTRQGADLIPLLR